MRGFRNTETLFFSPTLLLFLSCLQLESTMPASRTSKTRRLPVTKTMKAMKKRVSFLLKKAMNVGKQLSLGVRRLTHRIRCRR